MLRTTSFSLTFLLFACAALPKSPLASIEGQEILSIEVHDSVIDIGPPITSQDRIVCIIKGTDEIQFIKYQLHSLKARRYDHSSPEFDIVIKTRSGQSLPLRISKLEVGPSAPASAFNTHWFPVYSSSWTGPREFTLYKFLRNHAFENCTPKSPSPST